MTDTTHTPESRFRRAIPVVGGFLLAAAVAACTAVISIEYDPFGLDDPADEPGVDSTFTGEDSYAHQDVWIDECRAERGVEAMTLAFRNDTDRPVDSQATVYFMTPTRSWTTVRTTLAREIPPGVTEMVKVIGDEVGQIGYGCEIAVSDRFYSDTGEVAR